MSENKEKEVENVEGVAATLPLAMEVSEKEVLPTIEKAEKFVTLLVRFKEIALKATNNSDWAMMGPAPYLTDAGSRKIGQVFGIKYFDLSTTTEKDKDEKGVESITYTTMGKASWLGREIEEMGTGSTKDPFFGKKGGNVLPISEIDLPSVKKKSVTNFYNRCVKRILGLSFTMDDLKKAGINPASKIDYKSGNKGGDTSTADEKKKQSEIMNWLLEVNSNSLPEAKKQLKEMTGFVAKDKTNVSGVDDVNRLKGQRLDINHNKIKTAYESWKKTLSGGDDFEKQTGAK